ncbi:MAG TPA: GTP-binding protein, partial [Planctomycetaceae bacterium]|nr:GTP-binding protein [Planctomycetaceae bacterium]
MTESIDAPTRPLTVAIVGNPNTGKSTLFNLLTGLRARVGNFPGVTVEKKIGEARWKGRRFRMIDLPGTYSLSPRSPDEMVSVNVLLGLQPDIGSIDAVVCILDASNLERNLYLASQVLDLGLPTVLVLNMWDVAQARGIQIDCQALAERLGVPVVPTIAHRKWGLDRTMAAIAEAAASGCGRRPARPFPESFYRACEELATGLASEGNGHVPPFLIERLILDVGGEIETRLVRRHGATLPETLRALRQRLAE